MVERMARTKKSVVRQVYRTCLVEQQLVLLGSQKSAVSSSRFRTPGIVADLWWWAVRFAEASNRRDLALVGPCFSQLTLPIGRLSALAQSSPTL